VLGEQSGDGMRRFGHADDDSGGVGRLHQGNLSMLRTTARRRAMMDA
jgi:hypothetical protein